MTPEQYPTASPSLAMYGGQQGIYDGGRGYNGYGAAWAGGVDPWASFEQSKVKGYFVPGSRRRLNWVPIALSILFPAIMFGTVSGVLSFKLNYEYPQVSGLITTAAFFIVVISGFYAAKELKRKREGDPTRVPSWYVFFFVSLFIAWSAAFALGEFVFQVHMRSYYDLQNLNVFLDVDPTRLRGQQIMDAGQVTFAAGSFVDQTRSMGFRNQKTYCVAPISLDGPQSAQYDFWAVGTDCCSGNQADFHCENFNNPRARSAMRLMEDDERPYYRLAVQQAEATYSIKATHPLFFRWVVDSGAEMDAYRHKGEVRFAGGVCAYVLFQIFATASAGIAFAKLGFR